MPADRLTAFLYLLMRDHLPSGTVRGLLDRVSGDEFEMSAPEMEALALRYSMPLRAAFGDAEEDEPSGTREPDDTIQQIEMRDGDLVPVSAPDATFFHAHMVAWLDRFDDRLASSPHFVQAVNEAAANEMVTDEVAARLVAQRVAELSEQAARAATKKAEETSETGEA